jgi:hypothetical protein
MYRPRLDVLGRHWETEPMRFQSGTVVAAVVMASWTLYGGVAIHRAAVQSQGTGEVPVGFLANDNPPAPAPSTSPSPSPAKVDDLLNLDIDQLSKVRVNTAAQATNVNAPSSQVNSGNINSMDATTTGEMAREAPSVSTRRTSAINLDPRVRGYHSGQLNATANGMY